MVPERMLRLGPERLNGDGEFTLAARTWHADVIFASGAIALFIDDRKAEEAMQPRVMPVVDVEVEAAAVTRV